MNTFELAVRAERVDTLNWMDQHAAAPASVREALGLASHWHGELAMESPRLNPGVGEWPRPVAAEEQDAAGGWHQAGLVRHQQAQSLHVTAPELAHRRKAL